MSPFITASPTLATPCPSKTSIFLITPYFAAIILTGLSSSYFISVSFLVSVTMTLAQHPWIFTVAQAIFLLSFKTFHSISRASCDLRSVPIFKPDLSSEAIISSFETSLFPLIFISHTNKFKKSTKIAAKAAPAARPILFLCFFNVK